MGAGKSAVAAAVGAATGARVIDTDAEMESRNGVSIRALFAELGEAEFRAREAATIRDILGEGSGRVIAFGGGAFLSESTRAACCAAGARTVYLYATPSVVAARLAAAGERDKRPLLAGADPEAVLARLFAERDSTYRLAELCVDTDGRGIASIADEVMSAW
ncbi:MAG: shikimate kinase [Myxococcales bacterium]|nr:shikimate kinase [Myxococcales bacterium]MCB9519324.1 shikimate kinase [Myxococcales bacterium]MCB9530768.1 shikimate kinase [Myxococcales bacterium]MCB9533338.1 shikimate kinase [Myxococcales bacterium]